jgi:hypothetical protein
MRPNREEPKSALLWFQNPKFGRMAASYRGIKKGRLLVTGPFYFLRCFSESNSFHELFVFG